MSFFYTFLCSYFQELNECPLLPYFFSVGITPIFSESIKMVDGFDSSSAVPLDHPVSFHMTNLKIRTFLEGSIIQHVVGECRLPWPRVKVDH